MNVARPDCQHWVAVVLTDKLLVLPAGTLGKHVAGVELGSSTVSGPRAAISVPLGGVTEANESECGQLE
jgi:hypothetical protein